MSAPSKVDSTIPDTEKVDTDTTVLPYDSDNLNDRIERAQEDARRQAEMPVKVALHKYRGAVLWSALMTLTIVMEAYDYGLIGNLFGFPQFVRKFGTQLPNGKYNIDAASQSVLKQITKAGQLVGLAATGWIVDRIGYKWTMLGALVGIVPIVFMQFFAPNKEVLIAAQFLIGIPLAPFLTLSNVYASEVSPLALQPYMTSATSLAWSVGGFISVAVLRGVINVENWGYQIAFAIQWIWILPLALIIWFAPESPTWCIKTGRIDRARISLRRLASPDETEEQVENRLALMQYTDAMEREYASSTSYLELFKGVNLRRTEVAVMAYSCMNLDGYTLAASGSYFFQQAGLDPANSFTLTLVSYSIQICACLVTWFIMRRFGRRPIYILGLGITVAIQLAIGGLGIPEPSPAYAWGTGGVCWFFNVVFNLTRGPLTYCIITDAPSTRLRSKTVVFARAIFLITAVFMVVLVNYQINAANWNWRGKAGFFWAGSCSLCFLWAYFRLPETKDRSPAELDRLFIDKVPARKFKQTTVDVFDDETQAAVKTV